MDVDPRAMERLRAEQADNKAARTTGSVQYKAIERAAQQSGQTVEELAKSQGTTVANLVKDMKRGGGGSGPLNDTAAGNEKQPGRIKSILNDRKAKKAAASADKAAAATKAANEAADKTARAAEEAEQSIKLNPIVSLPQEVRSKARFKLTNAKNGKVIMVVSFANNASEADIQAMEKALESKIWSKNDGVGKGYNPTKMAGADEKPFFAITDTSKVVSLIEELNAIKAPIGKSRTFESTPRFEKVLELHGIKWKTSAGQER